jgi:hypothetical protein
MEISMIGSKRGIARVRSQARDTSTDGLSFEIELWDCDHTSVERILARAATVTLARTIFTAARTEYPDRYLTLRQGTKVLDSTGEA